LQQRGYTAQALARDALKLAGVAVDKVVIGDLTKPQTLRQACANIDAVISCAGAAMNVNDFGNRASFYEIDYQGNLHLLAEAQRAGVKKFVYISLAEASRLRHTEYADAHEKFVEALRASGLNYTIVRPTGFFSFYLEILKFAKKGRGVVIGSGACRTNPIHEADVAVACVDALSKDALEIAVGGPEIFTRKETVELAFAVLQRPPRLLSISPGLFKLMIAPLRLINRRIYALMDFGIAVTQLDVVAPAYGAQRLRDYFEDAKH
jgi:uncharacterized protein YbjT (DUF2867 family)